MVAENVAENAMSNEIPEKQLTDFVSRLRESAGDNLQSVILYGSAAGGEFHPEFSNLNLLCILREISFSRLNALASAVQSWTKQKHAPPLLFTREELARSTDVFAIEFLDMQRRHRLLFGDDVLSALKIPLHAHKLQVEYELREKLIRLREAALLAAGNDNQLWELLLRSLPAFTTLFRHALIALGDPMPDSKRAALQALSAHIAFDASPFLQLLDIRESKLKRKQLQVSDVFSRYLSAIQQVVSAVDTMLEPGGPART
jgi:hypothetical protein